MNADPSGNFDIGQFFEGVDAAGNALVAGAISFTTISASIALEPPSFGLSTAGVVAGVVAGAGAISLGYVSYYHFSKAF